MVSDPSPRPTSRPIIANSRATGHLQFRLRSRPVGNTRSRWKIGKTSTSQEKLSTRRTRYKPESSWTVSGSTELNLQPTSGSRTHDRAGTSRSFPTMFPGRFHMIATPATQKMRGWSAQGTSAHRSGARPASKTRPATELAAIRATATPSPSDRRFIMLTLVVDRDAIVTESTIGQRRSRKPSISGCSGRRRRAITAPTTMRATPAPNATQTRSRPEDVAGSG